MAGPKHSTSIPFSLGSAVPLSVDVNEVALVPEPKPVPALAVKTSRGPQREEEEFELCIRGHSLLPFTLQMVKPAMFPSTVQLKLKVSPGQVE